MATSMTSAMSNQKPQDPNDNDVVSLPPMDTEPMRASEFSSGPLSVAKSLIHTFSTTKYQRDSPMASKTKHIRLISITVSHFCEKIRWALDLLEEDSTSPYYYTEDGHPPVFVAFYTVPASNQATSATPMVMYDDGTVENDSAKLLTKFCPFLYPEPIRDEVQQMELDIGQRIGATLRCFMYHHLLQTPYNSTCVNFSVSNSSKIEANLFGAMFSRGISDGMRQAMKIDEKTADLSHDVLIQMFEELSQRLEESGGEYLMDTKEEKFGFTAADLALAALAYPLIRPPEMLNFILPKDEDYPPEVLRLSQQLQSTRAGQHVLRMYQKHRPTNSVVLGAANSQQNQGVVVMKSAKIRDRWCFRYA